MVPREESLATLLAATKEILLGGAYARKNVAKPSQDKPSQPAMGLGLLAVMSHS